MTLLRVWSPGSSSVDLVLRDAPAAEQRHLPMSRTAGGWWERDEPGAPPGTAYGFSLDGGDPLPDPRAVWIPDGVHDLARVYDHAAFPWTDGRWRGTPLVGAVLYELHVGTFTPEGTFAAAAAHLDHLVDLGVTAVELLPVNGFDGRRGWGYDGVLLYGVHEPYGGPDELKRFVDACHARGLGVVMDVVYNHLGPSGNYLADFGPYFTDTHVTPWGPAVNLDAPGSDEVRRFVLDNALHWLRDFHCDGLRLDAVHALADERATHVLEEMAREVEALGAQQARPLFLVAESDLNDPGVVTAREAGGWGMDGQWCDDVHHALHSALTGETQGYYADFGSLEAVAKTMTGAFFHDGTWSTFRGRAHGRPVDTSRLPGHRFVTYLQDHDQVGNRATGDRISGTLPVGLAEVGAALVACSPFTPMLFMGEEWGASSPWQFFSDHAGELGEAVRRGRREEFADHGWDTEDVPDPQAESTFRASTLDWEERGSGDHARLLDWHRHLYALRRRLPDLSDGRLDRVSCTWDTDARCFVLRRGETAVAANLAPDAQEVPLPAGASEVLLASGDAGVPEGPLRAGDVDGGGTTGVRLGGHSVIVVATAADGAARSGG